MKKILITIIGLLASGLSAVQAQAPFDYVPLKYSTSASKSTPDAYIKKLKPKYLTQNKDAIKDLNKFLYGVNLSHVANAKGKYYIEEVYVKKYLQNILDDLSAKNNFKEKYEVHCTRDISVNAYNMGDNRVYVNIGLLKLMTNEAQIAFLLAHELAHYLLLHVQEKFLASRDLRNSKKVKQEIKDIKKAKYNKTDLTVQLMKNYGYEFAKNDRKTERAADSMAVVLVSNTDYDLSEGIALMKILEDSDKDTISVDYPAFFDNKDFQLNRDWLKTNDKFLSFGDKKVVEFDKDSMSTHPAIPFRIEMIQKQMAAMGYSKTGKK
ncbi:MAG: M48 family metallopeptidase, partial [Chitinophagaceae bacterium]|nr:M48 family metallopeptidase [Chitinophagaceae bacterium]